MIAIVTETLSCLNVADCAAYGVSLAPLLCVEGDRARRDRIIIPEEAMCTTAPEADAYSVPPTVEAYRTRFTALLREFDGVLCITASRKFSESNRHATMAACEMNGRVVIIDSGSVAGGLFLLVLRARHLISLGYPMSRIKAELESYKSTLRVSFTANSTQALLNAKKLSFKMPVGRSILSQQPVFRIERGGIGVATFVSGEYRAMDEMLTVLAPPPEGVRRAPSHVVVHYAERTRAVDYLVHRIEELYPSTTVYERPITLSLRVNLGHDIVGLIGD